MCEQPAYFRNTPKYDLVQTALDLCLLQQCLSESLLDLREIIP